MGSKANENQEKIQITVKPNSKEDGIQESTDLFGKHTITVRTKAPPIDGKANKEVIKIISKHLATAPSGIQITSGLTSKNKTILLPTGISWPNSTKQ